MTKRVLIIGGYGNFGSFISKTLASDSRIKIIIAGRSIEKAQALATSINSANSIETAYIDISKAARGQLDKINPDIVIHTSGPFQSQSYDVAEACIARGCHYIDLADGREFVTGIDKLDEQARAKSVFVVSGASSVPCLTSALVDYYSGQFQTIKSLDYGITTAQKTARGLATTAAILSYTGQSFETLLDGKHKKIYGWQGLRLRKYRQLGWRFLSYCNVPDLTLFPQRYRDLQTIRFYAGLEIPLVHITLWLLSWLVRIGLIKNLKAAAPLLLKTSFLFDWFGSDCSAFHLSLTGTNNEGKKKTITFELTARSGDGPYIPCMPAILLTRKIINGDLTNFGATPCIGLISRDEYLNALTDMDISWHED